MFHSKLFGVSRLSKSAFFSLAAGKIKAIATTAPARLPEMPNVPTMAELGYQGIGTNAWQGVFVTAATPKPFVDKL